MSTDFTSCKVSAAQSTKRAPILVISQNSNLEAFEEILSELNVVLICAESGIEALRLLKTKPFALILLNAVMPGMDAFDIARLIRSTDDTNYTPIIFVTPGHYDQDKVARAYELGAVDFFFYPINPRVIRSKISVFVDLFRKATQVQTQAKEVQIYKQELEQRLEQVSTLNNQLRRLSKQADTAREQAEATAKFKSEFLANMSHEIRTPLNGILGMTEMLGRTTLEETQKHYVSVIQEAGNSLLSVVNEVLDFSKMEAGKMVLEHVSFDIVQLVESVGEILMGQARKRDITLVTYIDPMLPRVVDGDPTRLRQILLNLTGNAIKFSEHDEVVISATIESEDEHSVRIRFSVTDSGIGMSEKQVEKLFQPFVQADGSTTRKYGGTGLGLSICKSLVSMMGGSIEVKSQKDQGSTFWFDLPFENAALRKDVFKTSLADFRLLVIEYQPAARSTIRKYLDAWGARNEQASTAEEGWSMMLDNAETDPFDIVILNSQMPSQNGLELTRAIRENEYTKYVKVIFLNDANSHLEVRRELDIDLFLTKPVKQSELLDGLSAALTGAAGSIEFEPNIPSSGWASIASAAISSGPLLIVEDHPVNQLVGVTMLNDLGFADVHVAENGRIALEMLNQRQYSLVFMDIQMPEINGLDVARAVRAAERKTGLHIPIVAMTAHAMEGSREECLAAGMDDYITKPINRRRLKEALTAWLPKRHVPIQTGEVILSPTLFDTGALEDQGEPLLNFAELQERFGLSGADRLLEAFLQSAVDDLVEIKAAYMLHDSVRLADNVHRLKGVCAQLSARKLKAALSTLENTARVGDWEMTTPLIPQVELLFNQTYKLIESRAAALNQFEL